jgi:5-methylcytosine-specific restriction endonuclease McrA
METLCKIKICSKCRKEKSLTDFGYIKSGININHYQSYCKQCMKEYGTIWSRNNPIKNRAKSKQYQDNHPGWWKPWREKNKDKVKLSKQRMHAIEKGGGELTIQTIQRVYEDNIKKYGVLTCVYCLKPIEFGKDTLEHKIPLIRGGTNLYENLAIACFRCNPSKGDKLIEEWKATK